MIKKIIPIILCLCLVFSISASAADSTDSTAGDASAVAGEMPMRDGGRQGGGQGGRGGRGDMGAPPQGENRPAGEMPDNEMSPPQGNDNTETGDVRQPQSANTENADASAGAANEGPDPMQTDGELAAGDITDKIQETTQLIDDAFELQYTSGIISFIKTYSTPITSVILLISAFVFVVFYKRKRY